ncbi:MED14-domain-containing protein [Dendrothele bispora CBS 962.96]|uniref:Mediator of RNA polymerase II transcription subunit 14 n=1 Tax=Dendrothele bispora (strain CBS 962.96) TaxID=1314807 RepID=A0A4S8MWA2_DENBC|nr:MED14-domain-containing protein [Dendrothele bispora CBS 962.96]
MNGESSSSAVVANPEPFPGVNGVHVDDVAEPTLEQLEAELPVVMDGQIPLGEVLSRVMQAIYTELQEMGETLPNQTDTARKRTLADWVVKTKKQVVKLYAVAKWARDADTVQKCMNITAFLMDQNHQFESAIHGLTWARQSLDPARLRNHDLLTSLDVLTTGSYRRLPTGVKKSIIPPTPLTDDEVIKTLLDIQDAIRYRLRLSEIIPIEMSRHRIADGRVYFTSSNLFECSLCLTGTERGDGWFFVHVEFLIRIGGDLITTQEFPRVPTGFIKRHITDEVDRQLSLFRPEPQPQQPLPPGAELPRKQELPDDVVDTPLVRVFNFLQMMSLSYQLEILWYQAERMRALGWGEYLNVNMSPNRKTLTVTYWVRKPPPQQQNRPTNVPKIPLLGGTLTVSIVESPPMQRENGSFKIKALAELQQVSKLQSKRPSDTVEHLKFDIRWEPAQGALAVALPREETIIPKDFLVVTADNLDFEALLRKIIYRHTKLILARLQFQLSMPGGILRSMFSGPGVVSLVEEGDFQALKLLLCADKYILITIDTRTGRIILRDVGELAATNTGSQIAQYTEWINHDPTQLMPRLVIKLRLDTIIDLVEQKANYLGLQNYRTRPFLRNEIQKLAPSGRMLGAVYIRLRSYTYHYLVVIIADEEFQYALITVAVMTESATTDMLITDVAFLDSVRIHGDDPTLSIRDKVETRAAMKTRRPDEVLEPGGSKPWTGFQLETQLLRELYSYCCARVAYMKVENQLKLRKIPWTLHLTSNITPELGFIQSSIARSVPALCVQSSHILAGAPAAEAAMPNIRVIPLNWWSEKNAHVVTCVKLKYVQQPLGKSAGTSAVIRPSKRIIYDTTEAVVSFLSDNIDKCVDEFAEEWARVSKMVVIAREVAQMSKEKDWQDVQLISFDLQTVEFAYAEDYAVSITTCALEDTPSANRARYDLRFSRRRAGQPRLDLYNPHDDAELYLRAILQHGHGRLAPSLHNFVQILRDTLPIVVELEELRKESEKSSAGSPPLDIFPKSAGWYRILYSDFRHALDFRLMTEHRVAIYDASHSLYEVSPSVDPVKKEEDMTVDSSLSTAEAGVFLQPIPDFQSIVEECVRHAVRSGTVPRGTIASVDIGVVCGTNSVRTLIRSIHTKVSEKLKES